MAFSRSSKIRRAVSTFTHLRNLFTGAKTSRGSERKTRCLRLDALEARQMLSVSPATPYDHLVNQHLSATLTTGAQVTWGYPSNQSVAVDNDGDFVVTWVGYDPILNPVTGQPVLHPLTKQPLMDGNVYARYYTDEVQRITLPEGVLNDTNPNHARFSLVYGGNEVQKLTLTQARTPFDYQSHIVGSFRLGFDRNGDGVISANERVTVMFNEALGPNVLAASLQSALQGLGGALEDVQVVGLGSTEFLIQFGAASGGQNQPSIAVFETGFTSGFLPSVNISTVSEPVVITQYDWYGNDIGIPIIPNNLAQTRTIIQQAFWNATQDYIMGPVERPMPTAIPLQQTFFAPEVDVRMISGNVFEITFVGASGKQDHPEFKIHSVRDEFGNELTPASNAVATLKEPSPVFRVNAPEVDDPNTQFPEIYNQFNPNVAMDADGDFVIVWESEVWNPQVGKLERDIFARRFSPQAIVPSSQITFYSDGYGPGQSTGIPVQGVRPLAEPFVVNTFRDGNQIAPSVAMDDQGNFTVAWLSPNAQQLSYGSTVYMQRYNRDGQRVGNETAVSTERTLTLFDPYVAMSDDGHILVAWSEGTFGPTTQYVSLWDPNGTQLVSESTGLAGGCLNITAAFDSQNNLLIVGEAPDSSGLGIRGLMYELYDATGALVLNAMRPPFQVNSDTWPLDQRNAVVGIDADGDIVIVYQGYGPDASQAVSIPASWFADEISVTRNADLLPFFNTMDPGMALVGPDLDAAIERILINAYPTATTQQLSRLAGILESKGRHLRSVATSVLYTRLESDPRLAAPIVVASDAIVATQNDGNNSRWYIAMDGAVGGGNLVLSVNGISITINIAATNNVINIPATRDNLLAALNGAASLGGATPVAVRVVPQFEVQERRTTPWAIPVGRDSDIVFEVTFQGSVHDRDVVITQVANNLTTPGLNEMQTIAIWGSTPGHFTLGAMMPQPNNAPPIYQTTGDIYYHPANPQGVQAAIQAQLRNLFPGVVVTVNPASTEGYHVFDISFVGASGRVNQPSVSGQPSTTSATPFNGIIGQLRELDGGSTSVPSPTLSQINIARGGRQHMYPSVAMQPSGDFVIAWTEYVVDSVNNTVQTNIRHRRFEESIDTAGPQVTDFLLPSGQRLAQGGQVFNSLSHIVVTFDEEMMTSGRYSILDPANWALLKDGVEVMGGIASITFGMNQASLTGGAQFTTIGSNKWEAVITLDGNGATPGVPPLGEGHYEIVARDRLRDLSGNTLKQTGYMANGGVYSRSFYVMPGGGPETQVNDVIPGSQVTRPLNDPSAPPTPRSVASDGDGDFVVVWSVQPDGSGRQGVYAKLYDQEWASVNGARVAQGATPVKEIHVTSNPTACYASVAMDADGDFVVVWSQLSEVTSDSWDIYMRRFDARGNPLAWPGEVENGVVSYGGPRLVNTTTHNSQHYASVAMDADGDFVVAWQSFDQDGSGWGVYAQRFGPNGQALGGNDEVQSLSIVGKAQGTFRLDFQGKQTDPIAFNQNAFETASRIRAALAAIGVEVEATSISLSEIYIRFMGDNGSQNVPQMILTDLQYTQAEPGSYVRVTTKVDGASGEFLVNDTVQGNQFHPSVAMSAEGQFVITWTSSGQDGDAPYETNIYGKTFVANDVLRGTNVDASSAAQAYNGTAQPRVVTVNDPGNYVVAPGTGFDGVTMVEVNMGIQGIGMGTGSLLTSGRHILTAAHVVTDDLGNAYSPGSMVVSFHTTQGIVRFGVTQVLIHPTWQGAGSIGEPGTCDLAILVLNDLVPLHIDRYDIYRGQDELGKVMQFVGYGESGDGMAGAVLPSGTKRFGYNRIDIIGGLHNDPYFTARDPNQLYFDFDNGTRRHDLFGSLYGVPDLGLGALEANTAQGDSGGPWFYNGLIAGVTSWGDAPGIMEDVNYGVHDSTFGELGANVRVSAFADWIDSILAGGGGNEFLVNTFTVGDQKWSSVAMDASGDFVVTWTSFGQDGVGDGPGAGVNGHNGVFARRFHADGTPVMFQSDGQIIPPDPALPPAPPLPGAPVVVSPELMAGAEFLVNTFAADDQQLSQVSMSARGDFAIVWESFQDRTVSGTPWLPDNPNSFGIYAQRYAASHLLANGGYYGLNGQIGGEIDVNVTKVGDQRGAGVALNDNGDMVVAWHGRGAYDDQGVFYRQFNLTKDTTGPMVADVINAVPRPGGGYDLEQVLNGSTTSNSPTKFIISFTENLSVEGGVYGQHSVLNPANWNLTANGIFLSQAIVSIEFGQSQGFFNTNGNTHDPITNGPTTKYEAVVTFDGDPLTLGLQPLPNGQYTLTLSDQVRDIFGNRLDGNYDGEAGGSFRRQFAVGQQTDDGHKPGDGGDDDDSSAFANNLYDQESPAIAVSADGSYIIVGVSYGTATDPPLNDPANNIIRAGNIVARRFDRYGNPLGSEFIVNSWIQGHQFNPDVACDQYGNFVVVWAGEGQFDNDGIFARVFDAYGVPLGPQFQVNEDRQLLQQNPSVAMDALGNFVVAWQQPASGYGDEIYARRYNFSQVALSAPFLVNTHRAGNQITPDVAMSDNGLFTIVWASSGQDYYGWGIFGQRFNADGSKAGPEFNVNTTGDGHQTLPSIAMDAVGNFVVTWTSDKQDGSGLGVYGRRFTQQGVGSPEFRVNQVTKGDQTESSVSMAANGDFIVTWRTYDQEGINFDPDLRMELHDMGIMARLFKANGSDYIGPSGAALGEFLVNVTKRGNQRSPAVAMDADGDFMITWEGPDEYHYDGYWGPGVIPDPATGTPIFADSLDIFYRAYTINPGSANGKPSPGDEQHLSFARRSSGGGYAGSGSAALPISQPKIMVLSGTEGDDEFIFIAGNTPQTWTVRVNGVDYPVEPGTVAIEFDGKGGNDRVVLQGSNLRDTAEFWASLKKGVLSSAAYEVTVRNVEEVLFELGDGDDMAILWDSAGDDSLVSTTASTILSGTGYRCEVRGAESVLAYALQGGNDSALLYDSAGNDRLRLIGDDAAMYRPGSYIRAVGFEQITAASIHGGRDVAHTYGSTGNDTVVSMPGTVVTQGAGYVHRMQGFHTVVAVSYGGSDEAFIHDSKGDDKFFGSPTSADMQYANGSRFVALGFGQVNVSATTGYDRAVLVGSPGNDKLTADNDLLTFQGSGYKFNLSRFDSVKVDAGAGVDTAILTDTPGDDRLRVDGNSLTLSRDGSDLYHLIAFEQVTAKKKYGGQDEADIVDWVLLEGDWSA